MTALGSDQKKIRYCSPSGGGARRKIEVDLYFEKTVVARVPHGGRRAKDSFLYIGETGI